MIENEHPDEQYQKPRINLSYSVETNTAESAKRGAFWGWLVSAIEFLNSNFVTGLKILTAAIIILSYPAMVVLGHQLDDSKVELGDNRHWTVSEIGVATTLIARELDGPGWVSDKHPWHPQSRLTALPAWQSGVLSALSDHGRLLLDILASERDQDLIAAVRLLDTNEVHKTADRLLAATEAFARYDDRVAGGVTRAPNGPSALLARLDASTVWAAREYAKLADISNPGDGWLPSQEAIATVYTAKAVAHVTFAMLAVATEQETAILGTFAGQEQTQDMLRKWNTAARMRPLFVSNHGSDSLTGTSHPAILALHLDQARLATQLLAQDLRAALADKSDLETDSGAIAVATGPN